MSTPLEIDIALWYHCRTGDYGKGNGDNNFNAPAVQEALQRFVQGGLLAESPARCEAKYFGTEALTVWVAAICDTPWPVHKWVMPDYDRTTRTFRS